MVRKIRATVECGRQVIAETYDLPDDWDEMTERQQDDYLEETALTLQNNEAPCGASVIEVDE